MNAINLKGEDILIRQAKADGGLDWTAVTAVVIVGVEDYHG